MKVVRRNKTKRKTKRQTKRQTKRKHRGGAVSLEFDKPEVSNTSSSGAIQQTMHKQKVGNEEVAKLNKYFGQGGGGDEKIVVPQMNQAGDSGNKTITDGISQTLQGRANGEYDNPSYETKPDGMGGGRRKRKTKKRRRKRKSKKLRRKRKSKKRRRKRKTKIR